MRRYSRIILRDGVLAALVVAVVVALACGGWLTEQLLHQPRTGAATPPATKARPAGDGRTNPGVALGIYVGPGDPTAAAAADRALGGRVSYVLDFLPANTWTELGDPTSFVRSWAGTTLHLVIGVPMLPTNGGDLADGATGAYDATFVSLAQGLVDSGLGHSVLMIGWQPFSPQNRWQVTSKTAAAQYVRFWDHIHQAMANVPGAHFVFEWDVGTVFGTTFDPAITYPGDRAVDVIGTDAFDVGLGGVSPDQQWPQLLSEPYGPSWVASFAAAHHKSPAVAMGGLAPAATNGAGDNAAFLSSSLKWASTTGAFMDVLWDSGTMALTAGAFPAASAALSKAADQGIIAPAPNRPLAMSAGRATDGPGTPPL